MNAIMERRIQSCRHELLDHTLIRNQQHLPHALREYEQFYNTHRPDQGIANARPPHALPQPTTHQIRASGTLHARRSWAVRGAVTTTDDGTRPPRPARMDVPPR
jgi:hypothetical protein